MFTYLAPVLVFGLVIFIHEFGHFLAAKAVGVYAPRFSIGFGPALFRFRRGETEYVLAALPLGGYVRMASRLDEETAFLEGGSETTNAAKADDAKPKDWDPDAMIPFGPKPVPEHRWFESKPLPARLLIMLAGVMMNALLAIVIVTVLAMNAGRSIVPTTVVGDVSSVPSLGMLHVGDTISTVDGSPVKTWNEIVQKVATGHGTLALGTSRGGVSLTMPTDSDRVVLAQGLMNGFHVPAIIDSIVPGDRAAAGGLARGDTVVAVDGVPVRTWTDLTQKVNGSPEKPLHFDVRRAGATVALTITPKATPVTDKGAAADSTVGKIGVAVRDIVRRESVGLGRGLGIGFRDSWGMVATVASSLKAVATRKVSMKSFGGPIAITKASVSAAQSGAGELFWLIAFLSVNVAVFNLLPIPILDGGQIAINVIESAKGSPFSLRTREYILRFGLAAIALLFIVVMFNDTRGGLSKLFGWMFK